MLLGGVGQNQGIMPLKTINVEFSLPKMQHESRTYGYGQAQILNHAQAHTTATIARAAQEPSPESDMQTTHPDTHTHAHTGTAALCRVAQNSEPGHFAAVFGSGSLVIHTGERPEQSGCLPEGARLYKLKAENAQSVHAGVYGCTRPRRRKHRACTQICKCICVQVVYKAKNAQSVHAGAYGNASVLAYRLKAENAQSVHAGLQVY